MKPKSTTITLKNHLSCSAATIVCRVTFRHSSVLRKNDRIKLFSQRKLLNCCYTLQFFIKVLNPSPVKSGKANYLLKVLLSPTHKIKFSQMNSTSGKISHNSILVTITTLACYERCTGMPFKCSYYVLL